MNKNSLISDQLYIGSDYDKREIIFLITTEKEKASSQANEIRRISTSWFFDRALQALWKTRMQMCQGTRSWTKVLFINQFTQESARNGLCTFGLQRTSREVYREFSCSARYSGRIMYDQSRTPSAKREIVKVSKGYELYYNLKGSKHLRCFDGGNPGCQYDRRLYSNRYRRTFFRGARS